MRELPPPTGSLHCQSTATSKGPETGEQGKEKGRQALTHSCRVSQAVDYGIGKTVWLLVSGHTGESSDAQDQYGLHILFVLQDLNGEHAPDVLVLKAVLADTLYLQAVNYNTVSQAIVVLE
ncbi:UNVERIFIED_CONTAM: hypothetical protein FKN15_033597 [Acipenser sinensis]